MKIIKIKTNRKRHERLSLLKIKDSAYTSLKERALLEKKRDRPNNHTRRSLEEDECLSRL